MLLTATKLSQLAFDELMQVYSESNLQSGFRLAPDASEAWQLALAEQDFYDYLHNCFFTQPGAEYFVWEDQGHYVSALRLEPYRDGFLMEALETTPSYRNKGMAVRLIQAVLEEKQGITLYSHISKKNKASLNAHLRCGFCVIQDCAAYIDGSVDSRALTLCLKNF